MPSGISSGTARGCLGEVTASASLTACTQVPVSLGRTHACLHVCTEAGSPSRDFLSLEQMSRTMRGAGIGPVTRSPPPCPNPCSALPLGPSLPGRWRESHPEPTATGGAQCPTRKTVPVQPRPLPRLAETKLLPPHNLPAVICEIFIGLNTANAVP